ncbi:MAG: hypothetical protein ABW076_01555 [Candidatus Thiodiazotropha sp.]
MPLGDKTLLDARRSNVPIQLHLNCDGSVKLTFNGNEAWIITAEETKNRIIQGDQQDERIFGMYANDRLGGGKGDDFSAGVRETTACTEIVEMILC